MDFDYSDVNRKEELAAYVQEHAKDNDPESVLKAADEYCWKHWMMHVGDVKGKVLDELVQKYQPRTILELGTYCGYSAVRMARYLPEGGRHVTIDPTPTECSRVLVSKAGLTDRIVFLTGTGAEVIPKLKSVHGISSVDMVFLDHDSSNYLPDLKRIEAQGLLHKDTIVAADNVIMFPSPSFISHLKESGLYRDVVIHELPLEYTTDTSRTDGVSVAFFKGTD